MTSLQEKTRAKEPEPFKLELTVMRKIAQALEPLARPERARVMLCVIVQLKIPCRFDDLEQMLREARSDVEEESPQKTRDLWDLLEELDAYVKASDDPRSTALLALGYVAGIALVATGSTTELRDFRALNALQTAARPELVRISRAIDEFLGWPKRCELCGTAPARPSGACHAGGE